MNWAATTGLLAAAASAVVSIYGIVSARPKAKAEAEHIFAQTAEIMIRQLQEEVGRLREEQDAAWAALRQERLLASELNIQVQRLQARVSKLEGMLSEHGIPLPPD